MKTGLDTSVVLRLLVAMPADLAECALREVLRCQSDGITLHVSDLVLAETYYALQFHYRMSKTEALSVLREFLRESGIDASSATCEILELPDLAEARPGFVDRMIHAGYRTAGCEVLTFERAARKLPGSRVLTTS